MPIALPQGRQVRLDAELGPARVEGETQPGSHVVQDEGSTLGVADLAHAAREGEVGQLLVVAGVVLERGDDDAGKVAARRVGGRVQAGYVVVAVGREVNVILRGRAARDVVGPGRRTVVRAPGHEDLPLLTPRTSHHVADGRRVVAVLREDGPLGVADLSHETLGQVDDERRRPVRDVEPVALGVRGGANARIAVAGDHRPERAHEVDVLVAVGVPQPAALRPLEVLRVPGRQEPIGGHVTVHATREHPLTPGLQRPVPIEQEGQPDFFTSKGTASLSHCIATHESTITNSISSTCSPMVFGVALTRSAS